ncbi:MAG: gluconate 2-dehydrogenase subunit 3 family protein [Vicinamibacterales bacterium]
MSHTPAALSRRAALKALGTGAGSLALLPLLSNEGLLAFGRIQATHVAPAPTVLSAAQFATLEAFVEAIIPADERSPGAKEARVADYIDLLLSESSDQTALQWMGGLAALDEEASARFGAPFSQLDIVQADALLAVISANELAPQTPVEAFFTMTKHATIQGYYTSEIGIHQELRYKGNAFITEFVGCETENGKDCPHCGQRVERSHAG